MEKTYTDINECTGVVTHRELIYKALTCAETNYRIGIETFDKALTSKEEHEDTKLLKRGLLKRLDEIWEILCYLKVLHTEDDTKEKEMYEKAMRRVKTWKKDLEEKYSEYITKRYTIK